MKNTKWLLLLIVMLLFALPEVAAKGYQTIIYPSTSRYDKGYLKLAPDGKRIGFAYFKNGKHYVQINNKLYGGFEIGKTVTPFIKYSPDGKTFAFIFQKNERLYLQLNNEVYGGYTTVNLPLFSATGKEMGFRCANNQRWYLWLNGQRHGSYQAVEMPVFTSDETGAGFVYQKRSKWYVYINGSKYGRFRQTWGPFLSGSGTLFGFIGQKGKDGRVYYYLGEKRYGPVDRVRQFGSSIDGQSFNVYYNDDGNNYLHTVQSAPVPVEGSAFPSQTAEKVDTYGVNVYTLQNEKYLQIGDANYGGYQEVGPVVFGAHHLLWGYSYRKKGSYYVRVGERHYGPYRNGAFGPYFSANEMAFAYWYRTKGRIFININNNIYPEYDAKDFALLQLLSSFNGRVTGYKFRKNGREYVRVGQTVYGGRGTIYSGTLQLSNNGACFGYRYRYNNQEFVQINEKVFRCGNYQSADFVITPDNKACFGRIKDGKIIVQVFDYN